MTPKQPELWVQRMKTKDTESGKEEEEEDLSFLHTPKLSDDEGKEKKKRV